MCRTFRILLLCTVFGAWLTVAHAQDTLQVHGVPLWKTGMRIEKYCAIMEEDADRPLSFEQAKQAVFQRYTDSFQLARNSPRPLLIQWIRFAIRNQSMTDTADLYLSMGPHYFASLYDTAGLLHKSGIYETTIEGFAKGFLPLRLLPGQVKTFWLRTEDRRSHLVPPSLTLDTPFTSYKQVAEGMQRDRMLFLLLSMLTGSLFFISFFAAYQYWLSRDSSFLWYMAYTLSSAIIGLFWLDIRHQLSLYSAVFHDLVFAFFLYCVPVLYSLFIGKMLHLSVQFPRSWWLVRILLVVAVWQMVLQFVTLRTGYFLFSKQFGYFVSMAPVTLLNLILLGLTAFSREKIRWFMFCGLLSMLLLWCMPMIVFPKIEFRLNKWNMVLIFLPFYFLLGLTIEAICFSFALSYRSKLILQEKNRLQRQYSADLEQALARRTAEIARQNESLEKQKIQQVQTAFEKKLAESEMSALRARMNPHFIFNCLNSIKLYTLENDAQTASEYLSKFSRLIRRVLEDATAEKITVAKELETLQLYIELEAMRFKDKVRYSIRVDDGIDQDLVEIPPLLLQPYVENAIWHGLMHRPQGGAIEVAVTQPADNCLQVDITDNGIGRAAADALNSKSATRQKSFGLQMTAERIDILNQVYGMQAAVVVNDLTDNAGTASGTKVTMKIPLF